MKVLFTISYAVETGPFTSPMPYCLPHLTLFLPLIFYPHYYSVSDKTLFASYKKEHFFFLYFSIKKNYNCVKIQSSSSSFSFFPSSHSSSASSLASSSSPSLRIPLVSTSVTGQPDSDGAWSSAPASTSSCLSHFSCYSARGSYPLKCQAPINNQSDGMGRGRDSLNNIAATFPQLANDVDVCAFVLYCALLQPLNRFPFFFFFSRALTISVFLIVWLLKWRLARFLNEPSLFSSEIWQRSGKL